MNKNLIVSFFTGGGLLDRGFKENGFCVLSAGDILTQQDIRDFNGEILRGTVGGVIGGSPCQDFSLARRDEPTGEGQELINEFIRVVLEISPDWFLLENVVNSPKIQVEGYNVQIFRLNATDCGGSQNRNRQFHFGHKKGYLLDIKKDKFTGTVEPCVMASEGQRPDRRDWAKVCQLQGLPSTYKLPFSTALNYKLVGNGVPVYMASKIAAETRNVTEGRNLRTVENSRCCDICGALLEGRADKKTCSNACRIELSVRGRRTQSRAAKHLTV